MIRQRRRRALHQHPCLVSGAARGHGVMGFAVGLPDNRVAAKTNESQDVWGRRTASDSRPGQVRQLFRRWNSGPAGAAAAAPATTDCSGAGATAGSWPATTTGGSGLALPFVRAAACSTSSIDTTSVSRRLIRIVTARGTRRVPSLHLLTLLGPTSNNSPARRCVMPSASSVARNSVAATGELLAIMMSLQICRLPAV